MRMDAEVTSNNISLLYDQLSASLPNLSPRICDKDNHRHRYMSTAFLNRYIDIEIFSFDAPSVKSDVSRTNSCPSTTSNGTLDYTDHTNISSKKVSPNCSRTSPLMEFGFWEPRYIFSNHVRNAGKRNSCSVREVTSSKCRRLYVSDDNLLYSANIDERHHFARSQFYKRVKSVGADIVQYLL